MTAPANDDFADAVVLSGSLPITLTGETNVDATTEVDEPRKVNYGQIDPADEYGVNLDSSVWYVWTCGTAGTYRFRIDSDFDAVLTVYTGSALDALTRIAQSDVVYNDPNYEQVFIDAVEDETYYVQVANYTNAYYPSDYEGTFDLELDAAVRPANDDFADAIEITDEPVAGSSVGASVEVDEPRGNNGGYYETTKTVWYFWAAPSSGTVDVNVTASGRFLDEGALTVAVFTGSAVDDLTELVAHDVTPIVTFEAAQGETYYFQIGSEPGSGIDEGDFEIEVVAAVPPPPPPPDNDVFAESTTITLSGGSATVTDSNVDETTQGGEPLTFAAFGFAGTVSNTVWFNWTADADGLARFDTFGSDFDTTAAAFTGGSVGGLTCLAFNDDYDGDDEQIEQSAIAWAAADGTTYYIQVASAGTASGSITAHLYLDPYPTGVTPDPPYSSGTASAYRIELRSLNSAGFDVTTESLELTSFSCNWRLNGPGAFEGTGVIGVTQADAANVGARELIVYKDDTAIWGGYLSYLDVDEDSRAVRVAAEGHWSRARMRLIRGDHLYKPLTNYGVAWKANVIAWDIIDQAQGASYGDMGWVYGGHSGTRLDCKRIYRGVDRQNIGGAIETLAAEGYFDFSLDVRATPSEGDVAMFRTWRRRGSDRSGSVNLSSSNAMQLNYSLSSSDMATVIDVFGSVQGCRGVAATDSQNMATYGRVEATPIDMETDEQSEVDNTASEFIEQHSIPAKNASVTYLEGVGPDLTDYDLGDTIRVTPGDAYVSYFDARVVGRELAVEAGRAVVTVEVER